MTNSKFSLIKGKFSAPEAAKVLLSLFDYKINYHNMEVFSLRERNPNAEMIRHEQRLSELKQARMELNQLLSASDSQNIQLSIKAMSYYTHGFLLCQ